MEKTETYVAFQVIPRFRAGNNFEIVDRAIDVVKESGVPYQVSAMETTMYGDLNELLEIIKKAQQRCMEYGALEVLINIKIHHRNVGITDSFCTYEGFNE